MRPEAAGELLTDFELHEMWSNKVFVMIKMVNFLSSVMKCEEFIN